MQQGAFLLQRKNGTTSALAPILRILNPFSVQFRYPGESATIEESLRALSAMKHVRKFIKDGFSL